MATAWTQTTTSGCNPGKPRPDDTRPGLNSKASFPVRSLANSMTDKGVVSFGSQPGRAVAGRLSTSRPRAVIPSIVGT